MCDIPVPVDDGERVVRAVFSNHLDKKNLRKNIFNDWRDEVSVMRHTYLGSDECKRLAREVKPGDPNIKYKGLAVIQVQAVREAHSEVHDSRAIYCGHGHISHNIAALPIDDPLAAQQKFALDERLRALKSLARYLPDPEPMSDSWTGEAV